MTLAKLAVLRRALPALACAGLALLVVPEPARAQWGDSYDQPQDYGYRRRSRDAYYRDDGYRQPQPRRYAPPQEAPRQFYWPWEDRPQQAAPQPQPTYRRPPRPKPPVGTADGAREGHRPAVKRRVQPPPATEPQKPAIAKTEPSVRIAVFGDSLADSLSRGLDDVFEDNADVAVIDRAKPDSGLVRRDVVDWASAAADYLKISKISYAVVLLGVNDRQPIREGDQSYEALSDRWRETYRTRVEALAKVFQDQKIPLIWVGTPPVRSESLTKDLAAINDIVRDAVQKAGGIFVDAWPGFVDDRNRFVMTGPDLEGQAAKLRTADGVHFTRAGARKLAHFADVELKRMMGSAAPATSEATPTAVAPIQAPGLDGSASKLDDIAAIDRQITAMLPSLPEPPGIPALPVKPAAGQVVPLGRAEISPGGTLASGRQPDGDASGNVERTLQRGSAPLPQPGRADDFRWPPG